MIPDTMLAALREHLAARTGLDFRQRGWADFEQRIEAAAADAGDAHGATYVRRLLAAPLAKPDIERLARHLTVGETYFFREPDSFAALESQVLPALLRAPGGDAPPVRIWCAGCCTGEEAYSVAILLDRLLPLQADRGVDIVATDINPEFLDAAVRGVYKAWSFRGIPNWIKTRYFKPAKDGALEVVPRIRQRVRFEYGNLVLDEPPGAAFDLILCRNVLMYFTAPQIAAVVARFHRVLTPGGYLLVSPAETSATVFRDFECISHQDTTFYTPARASDSVPRARRPALQPRTPSRRRRQKPAAEAEPAATSAPRNDPAAVPRLLVEARSRADAGDLDTAVRVCAEAIAADKLAPGPHYLLAVIELERDDAVAAANAFQRTLFLDPGFVPARVGLANILLARRKYAQAAQQLTVARKLLGERDGASVAPEFEGLTSERMESIVSMLDQRVAEEAQR